MFNSIIPDLLVILRKFFIRSAAIPQKSSNTDPHEKVIDDKGRILRGREEKQDSQRYQSPESAGSREEGRKIVIGQKGKEENSLRENQGYEAIDGQSQKRKGVLWADFKKGRKGCSQKKETYIYRACLEKQTGAQRIEKKQSLICKTVQNTIPLSRFYQYIMIFPNCLCDICHGGF